MPTLEPENERQRRLYETALERRRDREARLAARSARLVPARSGPAVLPDIRANAAQHEEHQQPQSQQQQHQQQEAAAEEEEDTGWPTEGVAAEVSRCEMTQLVLPTHANTLQVTFGGQVMQWMETCASVSAMRVARQPVLQVACDELHFAAPSRVGELVQVRSQATRTFRTSIEVYVEVEAEDIVRAQRRFCNSAYFSTSPALQSARRTLTLVQHSWW